MSGFLFEQIIFGPIRSRRLGISLGVNLLPTNKKHCTFNCIYCECGWTQPPDACMVFPERNDIRIALEQKLIEMQRKQAMLDSITYAGNGEPTIHPDFANITDDIIELRNEYFPDAKISLLSNASRATKPGIKEALLKIDQPILKLDCGTETTFQLLNNPSIKTTLAEIVNSLIEFNGKAIIQTLFVKGVYEGKPVDNTSDEEVNSWLGHLEKIKPRLVMIYPIARETPVAGLEVVPPEKLTEIASKVEQLGIGTEVY
jgi:wyosine [tRNA(Phe)-imidazoG37] synthetase (radical SAM superfamily)